MLRTFWDAATALDSEAADEERRCASRRRGFTSSGRRRSRAGRRRTLVVEGLVRGLRRPLATVHGRRRHPAAPTTSLQPERQAALREEFARRLATPAAGSRSPPERGVPSAPWPGAPPPARPAEVRRQLGVVAVAPARPTAAARRLYDAEPLQDLVGLRRFGVLDLCDCAQRQRDLVVGASRSGSLEARIEVRLGVIQRRTRLDDRVPEQPLEQGSKGGRIVGEQRLQRLRRLAVPPAENKRFGQPSLSLRRMNSEPISSNCVSASMAVLPIRQFPPRASARPSIAVAYAIPIPYPPARKTRRASSSSDRACSSRPWSEGPPPRSSAHVRR